LSLDDALSQLSNRGKRVLFGNDSGEWTGRRDDTVGFDDCHPPLRSVEREDKPRALLKIKRVVESNRERRGRPEAGSPRSDYLDRPEGRIVKVYGTRISVLVEVLG
jgi:hypothetical protein